MLCLLQTFFRTSGGSAEGLEVPEEHASYNQKSGNFFGPCSRLQKLARQQQLSSDERRSTSRQMAGWCPYSWTM